MNRAGQEEIDIGISGIRKLGEILNQKHGFDLNVYAGTFIKRRISRIIQQNDLRNLDGLLYKLESDNNFFMIFQSQLVVEGTEFFRDPAFWRIFRNDICKSVQNSITGKIKIWFPGCSSGEEVITAAIALTEAGLYENAIMLATDINEEVINQSRKKIYNNNLLEISENNYKRFREDESADFSAYYKGTPAGFSFSDSLYRNISYEVFNIADLKNIKSVNIILSRNQFIYFTSQYQENLLEIYADKLTSNGYLAIGNKENISFCKDARKFTPVNENEKIYRKTT